MSSQSAALIRSIIWALMVVTCVPGSVSATEETPVAIVKDTISRILETLSDNSLNDEQARAAVEQIASERINYYEMGQRILARNWSKADDAQKARFVELFRERFIHVYWSRIRNYSDEDVLYFTATIDRDIYATVDTIIQTERIKVPVTYRLKFANGRWLAYDFLIENKSMISTYRATYAQIIKNKGIDKLLTIMATGRATGWAEDS
jgi:ABC-type transporter MlaC component